MADKCAYRNSNGIRCGAIYNEYRGDHVASHGHLFVPPQAVAADERCAGPAGACLAAINAANARAERTMEGLRRVVGYVEDFAICNSEEPEKCVDRGEHDRFRYVEELVSDLLRDLDAEAGR